MIIMLLNKEATSVLGMYSTCRSTIIAPGDTTLAIPSDKNNYHINSLQYSMSFQSWVVVPSNQRTMISHVSDP